MDANEHREYKEYMLEWYVDEPYNEYYRRFFKTLWDARIYANNFDNHAKDIRIYKLEEEYIED